MAQYQHLPIYKQTYDILLRTMTATKDFPREYKYTLGQKIHAAYIANWLEVLKNDSRAVFTAAANAPRAADFIHKFNALPAAA